MRNIMTLFVLQYCFQDNADDSPTDQCLTQNQVDDNNKDEVIWVALHVFFAAFVPIYYKCQDLK